MGLFAPKKPKWQHKDPAVRRAAIAGIDPGETAIFEQLGRDPDREVRRAAVARLADVDALARLAADALPEELPLITARMEELLAGQVLACQNPEGWQDALAQIASPEVLAGIAAQAPRPEARLAAVDRIDDQRLLAEVVKQNCGKQPAAAALAKISDEGILADLRINAAGKTARRLAGVKIAEIERQKNPAGDKEIVSARLDALATEANRLGENPDPDAAVLRLAAIRQEWQSLDSDHAHPGYATLDRISRIVEARYAEASERLRMGQEKAARYDRFRSRLEELCVAVERLSCSTTDDAPTLQARAVADWEALIEANQADFAPSPDLAKRFADASRAFTANRKAIESERLEVVAIQGEFSQIQSLIAGGELKKAAMRLAETEKRLALLPLNFFSKSSFARMLAEASSELDRAEREDRERNLARRRKICAELEKLAASGKPGHMERRLRELGRDWQELPRLDDAEGLELAQRFQTLTGALTEKLKTLEHEQDWQLWANLTLKEKLLEQVAALDHEENLAKVFDAVKAAQAEWKDIGPVPQSESQRLWDDFQGACQRNFERTRPYLEERKQQRIAAMERRREICGLAAELAESGDWQKTAQTIKELQQEWKTLPHGAPGEEHKLYRQFRAACDRFFARREEHHLGLAEERGRRLLAKEELCREAEQLAAAPRLDHAARLRQLRSAWKKIGPVPRDQEEGVRQRFQAACDTYFQWLAAEQQENLRRKEGLCEEAERLVAEAAPEGDRKEIAAQLVDLQRQWKEIGPAPPDRSEAVWQRFRRPCDEFFTARQQEIEQDEEQRRANQDRKEALLARAEELAGRGNDRETAAQLQQLQKEWFETGPAPRPVNRQLNDRFQALADAFFAGRRQYFADLRTEQLENQKKKESLCLRLENILGLTVKAAGGEKSRALSLADELKQAMQDNFMLAGRRHEKKEISDEIRRIRREWEKIGPVPADRSKALNERYRKALDAYYNPRTD
ncbi:MAG: DUF349 domain-containing protein [Thermodesulfobacteriota bacterium]